MPTWSSACCTVQLCCRPHRDVTGLCTGSEEDASVCRGTGSSGSSQGSGCSTLRELQRDCWPGRSTCEGVCLLTACMSAATCAFCCLVQHSGNFLSTRRDFLSAPAGSPAPAPACMHCGFRSGPADAQQIRKGLAARLAKSFCQPQPESSAPSWLCNSEDINVKSWPQLKACS